MLRLEKRKIEHLLEHLRMSTADLGHQELKISTSNTMVSSIVAGMLSEQKPSSKVVLTLETEVRSRTEAIYQV